MNPSQNLVKLRMRLGKLSKWTGLTSELAVSVASSIDEAMNLLNFTNAAEIEAALSLWIYHTRETERNSWNRNNFMVTQNLDPEDSEEDWLRHGETALQRQNPQFLGPYTPCLLRDLKWWTPRRSTLLRINRFSNVSNTSGDGATEPIVLNYNAEKVAFDEIEASATATGSLAVMTDNSLEISCGQQLLSSFMWAISRKVSRIENQANARQLDMFNNPTAWSSIAIDHDTLEKMARAVQKSGLGTLEEGYLCIIPPLSMANNLPAAAAVDSIIQTMKVREADSTLPELSTVYIELLRFASTFHESPEGALCPFSFKAVAAVVEYYRTLVLATEPNTKKLRDATALVSLKDDLKAQLEKVDEKTMTYLHVLYENQDRMGGLEDLLPGTNDRTQLDDVEIAMYLGYTPLHQDVISGKFTKVENPRFLDERNLLGFTPLHYAANIPGRDNEALIRYKASRDARDDFDRTPLHAACLCEEEWLRMECVKLLVKDSDDLKEAKDKDGKRAAVLAVVKKHMDVMGLLAQNDHDAQVALKSSAENGDLDNVKVLAEKGVYIDARDEENGRNALHFAAAAGHTEIVVHLLEKAGENQKSYVNSSSTDKRTALHHAANGAGDYEDTVRELISHGADKLLKDDSGRTPLLTACLRPGHPKIVKHLIHDGIDAVTALHRTIEFGDEPTTRVLVGLGVDLDAPDTHYDSVNPLRCAARFGRHEIVKLLLSKHVNLRVPGGEMVALHWTCECGHADIARTLLDAGTDIQIAESCGNTALHWAAAGGHVQVVRLLLERGADKNVLNAGGETPLDVCRGHGTEKQTPEGKKAV
ncbi:ankyrin repeat-containing domain protein [Tricharina praecox]|uniref:ankyrin repeat-containing domain protein n=1 Tax=Tricharina praecox TaxID=43433 RepID=UPI00221FAB5E|nr:ankyrin repeat-containing domain protein [Tricharina praecox]KAI5858076.1 ankyrin repeat-containing domain protein [Tricharina praecox]